MSVMSYEENGSMSRRTLIKFIFIVIFGNMLLFSAALIFAQAGNWQTINTSNQPIARHETSFVYAGGKFYLIGGRESRVVQIYNPATNQWTNGATAPKVMHHIQPVVVNNLIYAIMAYSGNCCDGEFGLSNVYIYDPLQNKWIQGANIPSNRRRGSTGVVYYQGKFYMAGGLTGGHGMGQDGVSAKSYNWFDSWNPSTNKWQVLPNAPHARDHFGAAVVNGKLYLAGGRTSIGSGFFGKTIAQVDVYNFATGQWSTLPASANIPTKRAGTAVATLGNEVIIIGGESSQSNAHANTEALNTSSNTWRTLDTLNQGRHGTTATVCNGMIYIAAGSPKQGGGKLSSMERYYQTAAVDCPAGSITAGQMATTSSGGFGEVNIGETLTRVITIGNSAGNQGLIVSEISLEGSSEFSVTVPHELPVILDPGVTLDLTVSYKPSNNGSDTATLRVSHHASDAPFEVALSGAGGSAVPTETEVPPTGTSAPVTETPTPADITNTPTLSPCRGVAARCTITPTTAATEAATATPGATETASGATSTPEVPTSTPDAAVSLLVNGGFETAGGSNSSADGWKPKNTDNDKRVVNKDKDGDGTIDKIVAYSGEAAFQFKGLDGENSKISQKLQGDLGGLNGTLTLRAWVKAKNLAPDAAVARVKIKYADDSTGTLALMLANTTDFAYNEFVNTLLLSQTPAKIKVQIGMKGAGRFVIDDVSLTVSNGALLPLP
jgi:N-acetylneuraminic acid mutarotase